MPAATAKSSPHGAGRRLRLWLVGGDTPRLNAITFHWNNAVKGHPWTRVPDGRHDKLASLDTTLPKALADFFVAFVAWSAGDTNTGFSYSHQTNAKPIRNACESQKQDVHKVFVRDDMKSCYKSILAGEGLSRPKKIRTKQGRAGKAKPEKPITLWVNAAFLPADCVEIFWDHCGDAALADAAQLNQLLSALRRQHADKTVGDAPVNPSLNCSSNHGQFEDYADISQAMQPVGLDAGSPQSRDQSSSGARADGERTRVAAVETIFLHFVDHDVMELFGLERIYPDGSLAAPFQQLARLSVMLSATRTIISAASCFETQYGLRLMRDLVPFVETRVLCAMGHAHDPLEYKDRKWTKLAMFPSRFPEYTSPLFSGDHLLGRGWLVKPTSSTLALATRWTAVANEQPDFWKSLYEAADQSFTRSTMRRIHEVPARLAKRPFMVADALEVLGIPAWVSPFRNAVNHLISSHWVDSIAAINGPTFLVDTPHFDTDPVVPQTAPRLSVSSVNQLLSSVGLSRVLYESSPSALLTLRLSPEWSLIRDDILRRAGGRPLWAEGEVCSLHAMGRSLEPMQGSQLTTSVRQRMDQYLSSLLGRSDSRQTK